MEATNKYVASRLREMDENRRYLTDQIAILVLENRELKAENASLTRRVNAWKIWRRIAIFREGG